MKRFLYAVILLSSCVTTASSPVGEAVTARYAPPAVTVRVTDEDGLPPLYDDALAPYAPEGPRAGAARRLVEARVAMILGEELASGYTGAAPAALDVEIDSIMLPDRMRFTPVSGGKSFRVRLTLTDAEGAVIAETARPFVILSEHQTRGRLRAPAWRTIGNTEDLRVEAIATLTEATALIAAEALSGGQTQTGLAGKLVLGPAGR